MSDMHCGVEKASTEALIRGEVRKLMDICGFDFYDSEIEVRFFIDEDRNQAGVKMRLRLRSGEYVYAGVSWNLLDRSVDVALLVKVLMREFLISLGGTFAKRKEKIEMERIRQAKKLGPF